MHEGRIALTLLFAILSAACGTKTPLSIDPPISDSGMDTEPPPDTSPPPAIEVECPRRDQYTTIRLPKSVEATVESTSPVARSGWTLVDAPRGSMATNDPTTGTRTSITPDSVGDYTLTFEAVTEDGAAGTCEVVVHSVVGPPVAICPEGELTTGVGAPLLLEGDAFDDVGVVATRWAVESGPGEAIIEPPNALTARFTGFAPGDYVASLTVFDDEMASDTCRVAIRVTAPPEVFCPMSPILAPTRQVVRVTARAEDDGEIAEVAWELGERPDGSAAELRPRNELTTRLTPDRQGSYVLTFTATDADGVSASCEVEVIGTPTPPTCMDTMVDTQPLAETELVANGVDDGTIVRYRWRLEDLPVGSSARAPAPRDGMTTVFRPDIVGEYRVTLLLTDDDGESGQCEYTVRAIPTEGLRVEIFWQDSDRDMDTHLLRPLPEGTSWFNDNDCYYANCNESNGDFLEWGSPGVDDNPRLDLDDTTGVGPENINIDEPYAGVYRVGVHAFRGTTRVTVRIYCGGSTAAPREEYGPITLRGNVGGTGGNDFWRVADVEITRAGGCNITELTAADGRPLITNTSSAERER